MDPFIKAYLQWKSFQQLEDDHGVCARPSTLGDKFSLNYDQLLVKNGDPVAEQCRGMVIRPLQFDIHILGDNWKHATVGDVEVLAWPMNRFYNFGDSSVAQVDWDDPDLKVYEKVDGTCVIVYWDPFQKRWHCATRSVPEADLPIFKGHIEIGDATFSDMFLRALIATREETSGPLSWVPKTIDEVVHLNKEVTYVFELVSPYNQIVVNYPEPRAYLLAARHTSSGQELDPETIRIPHVRRPKTWPLKDAVAIGAFVNTLNPHEFEGTVICDSKFRRMKIKSMAYVLAHKSKDTVTASPRNALEAIILEKIDDVIPLVPKEVGEKMLKMQAAYAQYVKNIDENVARFRAEADGSRKRFAEQVMLSGDWTAPYFNLWENHARSAREWIRTTCEKSKLSSTSLDTILSKLAL